MTTATLPEHRMTEALAEQARDQSHGKAFDNGNGHSNGQENGHAGNGHAEHRGNGRAQGPPPVAPANLAVELVLAAGGVPFCDETGVLKMRKPLPEGAQRFRQGFPILSRPMSAWLARMLYEAKLPPLTRNQQTQAVLILEGMAMENELKTDPADLIEQDPVLHMLGVLIGAKSKWLGTASALLDQLIVTVLHRQGGA